MGAEPAGHRSYRPRQDPACLCDRAAGLPPEPLGAVLADATSHRATAHRARRWQIRHILDGALEAELIVHDDWRLTALSTHGRSNLLEILDDRVETGSTPIANRSLVDT